MLNSAELRRRRREKFIIIVSIVLIVALTFIESRVSGGEGLLPSLNDVLIFGLININISLIILLIFLIVRNIVKLIYERRRGIVGSKLRTKLVAAFVSLTLIPTFILFLVATNFLSYSIDNWFNIRVGGALNLSQEVVQNYYQQTSDSVKYFAGAISSDITKNKLYEIERADYLKTLIEQRQKIYKVGMIEIYLDKETRKLVFKDPDNPGISEIELLPKLKEDIYSGKEFSAMHSVGLGDIIRGISPVYSNVNRQEVIGAVIVNFYVPKGLVDKMTSISKISEEYKQFKLLKTPIKFSYIIILFIVTLLIIFSATWFGFFLARGIVEPVQDLAEATHAIAQGNLDYKINVEADDEIGVLASSFNRMTLDLKKSKESLEGANLDLERRRKYMETVLRNVSAGVVAIDKEGAITTINRAAERMLSIKPDDALGKKYDEVLKPERVALFQQFLMDLEKKGNGQLEKQIQLKFLDKALTIIATMTILIDDDGNYMGMVVVFEDITQLQKAERTAAWREVARRIAHEIKNPLTPIQLSAQRLEKKFGDKLNDDNSVFVECTRTIVNQVDVLKNLVNEFSRYARMPMANLVSNDLNEVIRESIVLYQDSYRGITFDFQPGADIPNIKLDAGQIKRVMINLLDNAVAAVDRENGRIDIRTSFDGAGQKARVDVADNGCGISQEAKMRMFEPYYSTKKSGSGLGLAIVSSIISDHNGYVSVNDNYPGGTIVTFELPVQA
jgi:two-component system, NtrC family, nitrogen regulation sensor histidine kinase NtrY